MDDLEQRYHSENTRMKYVWYLTPTNLLMSLHQKVWTLHQTLSGGKLIQLISVIQTRVWTLKQRRPFQIGIYVGRKVHFLENLECIKDRPSACQYILKDVLKFEVILNFYEKLINCDPILENQPSTHKWNNYNT